MDDPSKNSYIIRPKQEAFEYAEGGTSSSVIAEYPQKVEFDKDEGYLIWFGGWKYPIVGLLDPIALASVDRIKKFSKMFLRVLATPPFVFASAVSFVLPMRKFKMKLLEDFSEICIAETKEFILKLDQYSRAVREIRRALEVANERVVVGVEPKKWVLRIIKAIAMTLENDRTYRYVVQDLISEVNLSGLSANYSKEIARVVGILSTRFSARKVNMKQMGRVIWLLVKLQPEFSRFVVEFIKELNMSKVSMDTKDKYGCYLYTGYDFEGLPLEQRAEIHKRL